MNENCSHPLIDRETQEGFECRELPKMQEWEFQGFLGALRGDIEGSIPDLASIVELLEKFKASSNETEKDEIRSALEKIFSIHGKYPEVLELEIYFYLIQAEDTWDWMHVRNAASIVRKLIDTHGYKTGTSDMNICDRFYTMLSEHLRGDHFPLSEMQSTILGLGNNFQKYFREIIRHEGNAIIQQKLQKIYRSIYPKK